MPTAAKPVAAMGIAPTSRASTYLQQLCKGWGGDSRVDFHATAGRISLPLGEVELNAGDMALLVTCTSHVAGDLGFLQREVGARLTSVAGGEGAQPLYWGRC
ncbi:MAG: DUF2218 domain-containing protein [Sphingomonadales bacterium]|nr:DUF2218 domain-containing protein [Sphingomonadales bacterium]MDE2168029.1 DUF2218 domain-containing protein [Sphingomonadales bacterium]